MSKTSKDDQVETKAILEAVKGIPALASFVSPRLGAYFLANKRKSEILASENVVIWEQERQEKEKMALAFQNFDPTLLSFDQRALGSFITDIRDSQTNRDNIALIASEYIKNESLSQEKEVDSSFMKKFYRYSSDITNAEAQQLWGKLLAKEIMHPGTFSFMFIDILQTISPHDAKFFVPIMQCMLNFGIPSVWVELKGLQIYIEILSKYGLFETLKESRPVLLSKASVCPNIDTPFGSINLQYNNDVHLLFDVIPIHSEFKELISISDVSRLDSDFLKHIMYDLRINNVDACVVMNQQAEYDATFDGTNCVKFFKRMDSK